MLPALATFLYGHATPAHSASSSPPSSGTCPFSGATATTPHKPSPTTGCPFSGQTRPVPDNNTPATSSSAAVHPAPARAVSSPPTPFVNPYASARALTTEEMAIVKSTAPVLEQHGATITQHFYRRMLGRNPELNNIFNSAHQATGDQQKALAAAVFAYAANIDNLGALTGAVTRIAHKHASIGITPDQYPIVGENLLASIAEVLGDAATPQILSAWQVAYAQLANLFIGIEKKLYDDALAAQGGWNGYRTFTVKEKVRESKEITSFYLYPASDGDKGLPVYQAGQYISIRRFVPELGYMQPRQYSLSCAPNSKYFRISVKRESGLSGAPDGRMSNLLHDTLHVGDEMEVSMPYGDYFLSCASNSDHPIVLVSAGVGLTPNFSMLSVLTENPSTTPITWIHSVKNTQTMAMAQELEEMEKLHGNLQTMVFFTQPTQECLQSAQNAKVFTGRIDLQKCEQALHLNNKHTQYYLCGPTAFTKHYRKQLESMGVKAENIHSEVFGSTH